jgi:hypothetical protein
MEIDTSSPKPGLYDFIDLPLPVNLGGIHKPCSSSPSAFRPEPVQVAIDCGEVADAGRDSRSEAGHAGAGLVQYKTSPNQPFGLTFSPSQNALRRVKRMKRNTYLAGAFLSLPRPGFRPDNAWFVTLTYDTKGTRGKGAYDWLPDHIARSVDAYRRWCKSVGVTCKYAWVAELQGNGNVHYHGVFWLPVGVRMPKWDVPMGKRSAFWAYGYTQREPLKTNVGYLMKYLSKMGELTRFPSGLRLSGCGGMCRDGRLVRSWHSFPSWVKVQYGVGEVSRCTHGFLDLTSGELLPPMYRRQFIPGGLWLTPLRDVPERWQGEHFGPYSAFPRSA